MKRAVVVFSGGQDSTTCLIQTIQFYDDVHCITFDYGQLHREEIVVSIELVRKLNIKVHKIMDIKLLNELAVSSLTRSNIPIPIYIPNNRNLSNTFVPGRNILFLTIASIYAYQVESDVVISGICETDFSGYPDCCNEFVTLFNNAICLGMARNIRFETPLMWLNKAETWALADYWHQLPMVRDETLTCYNGIKGNGCRKCAACYLRARGLDNYLANSVRIMAQMKQKMGL